MTNEGLPGLFFRGFSFTVQMANMPPWRHAWRRYGRHGLLKSTALTREYKEGPVETPGLFLLPKCPIFLALKHALNSRLDAGRKRDDHVRDP